MSLRGQLSPFFKLSETARGETTQATPLTERTPGAAAIGTAEDRPLDHPA